MFVKFSTDTLKPILQLLCRLFNGFHIVPVELYPDVLYGVFDSLLLVGRELVSKITQLFFALISEIIGVVACLCRFARLPVLFCMSLCILTQSFDFLLRQATRAGNRYLLFFTAPKIFRRYVQDAVSVNVERDFNLRQTSRVVRLAGP